MIPATDTRKRRTPAKRAFVGMAGSPLAAVQSAPAQSAPQNPAKESVLVHFCFNQEAGETKPNRCSCTFRVTKEQAYELIDAGRAHFLLVKNPKTDNLTKFHRAIVIRQTVVDGQTLYAMEKPVKVGSREKKHQYIRTSILLDARRVLQKAFAAGVISQHESKISDVDLEAALEDSEKMLARLSCHKPLQDKWRLIVLHWYNNILGFQHLNVEASKFMDWADESAGLVVTGGYDSAKLGIVDGAHMTDTGRVSVANHRASFWNGSWDFSTGTRPKVDQDEGDAFEEPNNPDDREQLAELELDTGEHNQTERLRDEHRGPYEGEDSSDD